MKRLSKMWLMRDMFQHLYAARPRDDDLTVCHEIFNEVGIYL